MEEEPSFLFSVFTVVVVILCIPFLLKGIFIVFLLLAHGLISLTRLVNDMVKSLYRTLRGWV